MIPISSSLTQDRYGHDRALGTCRDRSVVSPRTPCTSSSRIRRDCRRATTWSRLDSLPCVTTYTVCDQRSSGSKPIYVMRYCRHLSTAASKPKSVAGPSYPARCRSDDATTRRRRSRRQRCSHGQDRTAPDPRMSRRARFEPCLAGELCEHILSVIRAAGRAMSRAPKTHAGWGRRGPPAGSTQAGRHNRRVGTGSNSVRGLPGAALLHARIPEVSVRAKRPSPLVIHESAPPQPGRP